MLFFYQLGVCPVAVEQNRCCRQVLKTELDIASMQQIRELREAKQAEKSVAVSVRLHESEQAREAILSGPPQSLASHRNSMQQLQGAAALLPQAQSSL